MGLEVTGDGGTDAVVTHENVADAVDGNLHSTFTFDTLFPAGSNMWTAQAMHGSNEWTVRRTSSGCAASAIGLPRSDASYGPGVPFVSRGLAFQVVGTTAW